MENKQPKSKCCGAEKNKSWGIEPFTCSKCGKPFEEEEIRKELHLILLPAELVPDLEAQISNQILDNIRQTRDKVRLEIIEEIEKMKAIDPKDFIKYPRATSYNLALDQVLSFIKSK